MAQKPNIPKSQEQLSQDSISTYKNPESGGEINSKAPLNTDKNRENQIRRDTDEVQNFKVGIKDIDEAIFYYFNDVLRP